MTAHFEEIESIAPTQLQSFTSSVFIAGKSGGGKTNTGEWIFTQRKGKKIDLINDERHEGLLYSFPETHPYLTAKLKEFTGLKPCGYKNDIYFIAGKRLTYTPIPKNVNVVSLNPNDLDLTDLFFLLGTSDAKKNYLASLEFEQGSINLHELYELLLSEISIRQSKTHYMVAYSLIQTIRRWLNSGIFSSKLENLDLNKILKDEKTITTFSTYLQEGDEERGLIYGLLLKKIVEAKRKRLIKHDVIFLVREIADVFSKYSHESFELCRKYLLAVLREGRDTGMSLICDTQRMGDLNITFRRLFGINILMKSDYKEAEGLWEIQSIPQYVLFKIPRLNVGEGIILDGVNFYYPCFFPPCRHFHKKPNFDVLGELKKIFGARMYNKVLASSYKQKFEEEKRVHGTKESKFDTDKDLEGLDI